MDMFQNRKQQVEEGQSPSMGSMNDSSGSNGQQNDFDKLEISQSMKDLVNQTKEQIHASAQTRDLKNEVKHGVPSWADLVAHTQNRSQEQEQQQKQEQNQEQRQKHNW
jgi:hypothetical protein